MGHECTHTPLERSPRPLEMKQIVSTKNTFHTCLMYIHHVVLARGSSLGGSQGELDRQHVCQEKAGKPLPLLTVNTDHALRDSSLVHLMIRKNNEDTAETVSQTSFFG